MMIVKPKKHNECNMESFIELPVYSIKNDSNGYPHFLFYYKGEWLWKSAKHFERIRRKEKYMTLLKLWEKIGVQPLKTIRNTEAIIFIGDNSDEYKITSVRYENGRLIGFEIEPKIRLCDKCDTPIENESQ